MKVIAVIPARYNASRFPGKLMGLIDDIPVIVHTYRNTYETGLFEDVWVATDSEIIFNEIEKHGGKAIMSQKEHETGTDRIAEAVSHIDCDIVVNVQGDEPFVQKEPLEKLIAVFNEDTTIDVATLMQKLTQQSQINDPNFVKVSFDKNDNALFFSRSVLPYPREQDFEIDYYEHIGVYAFTKKALMDFSSLPMLMNEKAEKVECLRFLEHGMNIKMVPTTYMGVEIDTPEDLITANTLYQERKK